MKNNGKIIINQSRTADTRTCDYSKVTKERLILSSIQHIGDVRVAMRYFAHLLLDAGDLHDQDKLSEIDLFYEDFKNGFQTTLWYDRHLLVSRHHLTHDSGQPYDVDLIDVLEYIADCVMAGKARTGKVRPLEIDTELLMKAFVNTWKALDRAVEVASNEEEDV